MFKTGMRPFVNNAGCDGVSAVVQNPVATG